ncbi:MAG TPA: SufS family cysteine desulfurase, partial [Kofleriaceae bacterium]|nr:SufS family cysteine desulfurase [Kofleriaceae bacterium]
EPAPPQATQAATPAAWRREFPALDVPVHGRRLAYLDSASTSLKPRAVIEAAVRVFTHQAGNVHRGVHALSEAATEAFDAARAEIARFLGARTDEVVLTRGTTESINLVAHSWGRTHVGPGDVVIATALEHHSNLVPWQVLCAERRAVLRIAPIDPGGRIDLGALAALLDDRVKLVAVSQLSNVVGTIAPIAEIAALAHAVGAQVLVDGAQAIAHLPVNVASLGCDFYAFSGHKLFAPTGTGVLWGRRALLAAMPAWQTGGEMVAAVDETSARLREPPHRFEAGTPNIVGVIGLGAAIRFLGTLDRAAIAHHEARLHGRLRDEIAAIEGVRVLGEPEAAVVAFTLAGAHPHDVATIVDRDGVAIRSGHHCAEPLHHRLGADASARASLALYNDDEDLDALIASLGRVRRVLR